MESKQVWKNCYKNKKDKTELAEKLFSFENILKQYYQCRKRKRFTINAVKFEMNLEEEILKLKRELEDRSYKPGRSICFVISEPKPREIFAADFRDRVVHHILVDYLEKIWEPKFIAQSYSCRKEKGAHLAIKDLKKYFKKAGCKGIKKVYYLQADIRSFFTSLNKEILFELIKKYIKNPKILWLSKTIIFHNPAENYYRKCSKLLFDLVPDHKSLFKVSSCQGLPIGNLTSQFFANVYLNELDQFVKHKLKAKYYLRYVDDIIILSQEKQQLRVWRNKINSFLIKKLKLEFHPQKQIIQNIENGINFVGFITKPSHTLIRRRIVKNLKTKLQNANTKHPEKILPVINSYFGQFKHAQTFNLRKKICEDILKKYGKILKPVDKNLNYFKIAKSSQA